MENAEHAQAGLSSADAETNVSMLRDIEQDERALLEALSGLRTKNKISLETLAYVLGASGDHISKYLRSGASISFVNYLRIARALGYRCRVHFERVDEGGVAPLNKVAHSRLDARRPR